MSNVEVSVKKGSNGLSAFLNTYLKQGNSLKVYTTSGRVLTGCLTCISEDGYINLTSENGAEAWINLAHIISITKRIDEVQMSQ